MKGELIAPLVGDRGIVNAARVSFDADDSSYPDEKIPGLVAYLFRNRHWSPFAHCRLIFGLDIGKDAWLHFLEHANLAGFTWIKNSFGHDVILNGSLWAWYENYWYLPVPVQDEVFKEIEKQYPIFAKVCTEKLRASRPNDAAVFTTGHAQYMESLPINTASGCPKLHYVSFRMTTPIFVARQLVKHQQHLAWNEVSRRYVESEPELWLPEDLLWRARPDSGIKQGSKDELIQYSEQDNWNLVQTEAVRHYGKMIAEGIAPEEARIGLPLNMRTSWIWTGHLSAFLRVLSERLNPHAQKHTRDVAKTMFEQLSAAYPGVWMNLWSSYQQ